MFAWHNDGSFAKRIDSLGHPFRMLTLKRRRNQRRRVHILNVTCLIVRDCLLSVFFVHLTLRSLAASLRTIVASHAVTRSCKAWTQPAAVRAKSSRRSRARCRGSRLHGLQLPEHHVDLARIPSLLFPATLRRGESASRAAADNRECKRRQGRSCLPPGRWRNYQRHRRRSRTPP